MARPTIRDIGPAPSLSDPATFPARADATVGKLGQLVTDINGFGQWAETELIDQANAAANATALAHVGAAESAKTAAEAAKVKSQDWADKAEDQAVETGKYSAKHHAAKAGASATAAATSKTGADTAKAGADTAKTAADTAKTAAETARNKSQDWADKAEDQAVEVGKYSAKHHAAKAAASASAAATAKAGADTAKAGADNAKAAAEAAKASAEASAVAANVGAISAVKAETAVDVLIYDTSRDSDGGAWRHRCQHTGWFNEPLNTATRGARREFPSVAVIVVVAGSVTIYDGDDPALPMWKVIKDTVNFANDGYRLDASCVAARNGWMAVGTVAGAEPNNYGGAYIFDFPGDRTSKLRGAFTGSRAGVLPGITLAVFPANGPDANRLALPHGQIYKVAIAVAPGAPADPATGLFVPTVAFATPGGVSVLMNDGTVFNPFTSYGMGFVDMSPAGDLIFGSTGDHLLRLRKAPDYKSETAIAKAWNNGTIVRPSVSGNGAFAGVRRGIFAGVAEVVTGSNGFRPALARLCYATENFGVGGMAALIGASYGTGYLPGDIQGAWLSDTDTASLVGSELVTNGKDWTGAAGATPPTGWTSDGITQFSVAGGQLTINRNGGDGIIKQTISCEIGKTYVASLRGVAAATMDARLQVDAAEAARDLPNASHPGTLIVTFVAEKTSHVLTVQAANSTSANITIDDVSFRRGVADRSVKGKGLAVYGQITKAAVAPGAELVGYSGFSASNRLEQAPNADLDFGAGDFCAMGWVYHAGGTTRHVFVRQSPNAASNFGSGNWYRIVIGANNIVSTTINSRVLSEPAPSLNDNAWNHVAMVRQAGVLHLYTNGQLRASIAATDDTTNPTAILRLGHAEYNGSLVDFSAGLALFRIGKTAPTADQIAKIHRDERALFQAGAQCTLYGASDTVLALAHDPVTDLLHVGTSAGRSVFQGLRRVDSTTQAVDTAISASGGLVADE